MLSPALALALLVAEPAPPSGPIDLIERLFGASNVAWVIGNGGLTIGLSHLGEASVVTWPSPSYADQLLHLGSNDPGVRARRNLAVDPAMGAFVGLRVTRAAGVTVTFPRDRWTITQAYDPAPVLVTTMVAEAGDDLGVTRVTLRDWVDATRDAWVRDVVIEADDDVTAVAVLGYWNLSPTLSRIPQLPLADWVMDAYNDYAALWDDADDTVVHWRPLGRGDLTTVADLVVRPAIDYGPVGEALATGPISAEVAGQILAGAEGEAPGAWLVVGAREPILGHQIGFDDTPICVHVDALADNVAALPTEFPGLTLPLDPTLVDILRCDRTRDSIAADNGWSSLPTAAYDDLADGALEGSHGAAGQVDEALVVSATADGDGRFRARLVVAAGSTRELARTAFAAGRDADVAVTTAAFAAELDAAALPESPTLRAASERALTNLLLAQDRTTGAIVASIARQPPYGLDWPRDGAFFDYALDLAGLPARATKHARFTMSTQRTTDAFAEPIINPEPPPDPDDPDKRAFPAGGWEMNNYADGQPGGNIRWEIDNAALAIWSLIEHGERLPAGERAAWRSEIAATVTRGADLLARWRDATTGLHAPANEDDNAAYTQTLHGAATTWLALTSAAAHAGRVGESATASRWQARADELAAAIETHLRDPVTGFFDEGLNEAQNPGNAAGGATAWALWPGGMAVPVASEASGGRDQIDALLDLAEQRLAPTSPGGAYVTKLLLAAAHRGTQAQKVRARALLERFIATDAWLGETFVNDGASFEPRVANPHVWAGTLVYLTAMALDDVPHDPDTTRDDGSDDGCATGAPAAWILTALALAARRARRRP
ncbi:MAG: hypothetical protein IT385_00915 [Deltaproteobacteria bacterium]|nr:hypothetical protein [Deltaproteobacteria bacterium]